MLLFYLCASLWMCQVRIWEIPEGGLRRNMTEAVLELYGHSRRVGLIEWHPTTSGILFSAGYDYKVPHLQNNTGTIQTVRFAQKVTHLIKAIYKLDLKQAFLMCKILIWNLEIGEPVKMIDCHTDVILSMSFNTDGSLLATSCKDKMLRVIEPRSGRVLQVRLFIKPKQQNSDFLQYETMKCITKLTFHISQYQ